MKKIALFALLAAFCTEASASDKVSSPNVTEGKMDIEYRGGFDTDEDAKKDNRQVNKFVVNYGATDRLRPELKIVTDNDTTKDFIISSVETGIRWQFFKPDEAFLSSAAEINYKLSTESAKPDRAELKFLFGKTIDKFNLLSNISWEEQVGEDSKNGRAFKFAASGNYKIEDYFMPGLEYYADTGNLRDGNTYSEQKHSLGPVIYGKLAENFKYEAGYLFGISDSAPNGRAKLLLTYSLKF